VRFASTGALTARNTHPFEIGGRLFAHNGVIEDLALFDEHLGDARALVRGETDSERLFALITREVAARGGDVGGGIAAACTWVAANLGVFSLNFVLVAADGLWALRYPETHPLYVLEREPGSSLEHASSLGTRVRSAHGATAPLVVVATERLDRDRRWRALRSGELLHVGPDLQTSTSRVLDRAPAHPLSVADLTRRARDSQAA
jgi:glutamine amidotransferase